MKDGIGDRGGGADIAKLAYALDTDRIDLAVFLGNENDVDLGDVGINGNLIVGEIVI